LASSGRIDRSWSARLNRGIGLATSSLALMREQPGLLAVPVISSAIVLVICLIGGLLDLALPSGLVLIVDLAALAGIGAVSATGQAVIVHRVMSLIQGRRLTNADSFAAIRPRLRTIAAWGCLALTVGILIRSLERGRGVVGIATRILAAFLTVAWTALTFFVLPVIVFEELSLREAITRSREIVKRSWGEGVIGVAALSALFNLAGLAVFVLFVLLALAHAIVLAIIFLVIALVALNLLAAVASPIFVVVLYNFATAGEVALGFDRELVDAAFRRRRR
jgi:hypothetical protein